MGRSIPKLIHYCWFGRGEKPEAVISCICSWKKHLPDYQIYEWNEDNFSVDNAPGYVREAYKAKKYAFVSDYVRIKALFEYGGIYFDTDLEVLSNFETYLEDVDLILAFESKEMLMTAFIACAKGHPFIKEFLETYSERRFILENGQMDTTPNTDLWSIQAEEWGVNLKNNDEQTIGNKIKVYPIDIFCGFDMDNNHELIKTTTKTVHHMANSWADSKTKRKHIIIHCIQTVIGFRNYDRLRAFIKGIH